MDSLETELQKICDSEIHIDISWGWEDGIDVSVGQGHTVIGNVKNIAEIFAMASFHDCRTFSRFEIAR
jgi:hypothetical protein